MASAQDVRTPKISIPTVDWDSARAALNTAGTDAPAAKGDVLRRLNRATGKILPTVAASPVPVLLPFDRDAFLQSKPGEETPFQTEFGAPSFFLAGPAGYDAAFSVPLSGKPRDVEIEISGFGLLYELEERTGGEEKPLALNGLQTEFPGLRRFYFESHMRYLFKRYGVLYEVSVECFDAPSSRRLSCTDAHGVVARFLQSLNVAGGTPRPRTASAVLAVPERPDKPAAIFSYHPAGQLIAGTGSRQRGGDEDHTIYAPIRFPLADGPAQVYSQLFMNPGDCTAMPGDSRTVRRNGAPFRCAPKSPASAIDMPNGGQYTYPWRDNFCERRAYYVGQCPSGLGHQGQDIVPVGCALLSRDGDECDRSNHRVVAVHDGVVHRAPRQEGLVIVANAADRHVRFRYLHMNPRLVDADGFFSGRVVRAGDVVGKVSNFAGREAGTSYHLHFDMQVPTKDGWVLVNPYMTLVTAYERLIGGRGIEINEDSALTAHADISEPARIREPPRVSDPARITEPARDVPHVPIPPSRARLTDLGRIAEPASIMHESKAAPRKNLRNDVRKKSINSRSQQRRR